MRKNGKVDWKARQQAFGATTELVKDIANPLRFPGQYYDGETGLHYNYFRYYDPEVGRYITSDPIGLDGGLNSYVYVVSNPVLYMDVFGDVAGIKLKHGENGARRASPEIMDSAVCMAGCLNLIITITEGERTKEEHELIRKRNPRIKNKTTKHFGGNAVDVRAIQGASDSKILCCASSCGFTRAKKYRGDGHWHFDKAKPNGWGEKMPKKNSCINNCKDK